MNTEHPIITPLVQRFVELQKTLGLGNTAFAARYKKFIPSERAWDRLKDGTWAGHHNEQKLIKGLQDMVLYIEAAQSFTKEEFILTPFARRMNANFERLLGSTKDRRCLICLAPEGVGKSWWASSIVVQDTTRRFYLRLSHTWREKSYHIARGIAERIGAPMEKNPSRQMESLIAYLRAHPNLVLILDEAHNGGVAVLKLIKDLIDETDIRIIYLAFPTEFDRVRNSDLGSMAEARQIFRRCIRPIFDDYRDGIGPKDIQTFLVGSGFPLDPELKTVAATLAPKLCRNQNLSTLADAIDEARCEAAEAEGDVPPTLQLVHQAVNALCSTWAERRATA
jgi:hypothetical protein